MRQYYVYIMASRKNGTVYVGVTNDIVRRVYEHKNKLASGFTKKYDVTLLVYFEMHDDVESAIAREKRIKGWLRKKKIELIEKDNPLWLDISLSL